MRALTLLLLLGGCNLTEPLDFSAAPLAVHGVITAGTSEVSVLLTRSSARAGGGIGYVEESGAEVWLSWGKDSARLVQSEPGPEGCWISGLPIPIEEGATPAPPSTGCYGASLPDRVVAGMRYDLHIRTRDGLVARGRAVPPDPPDVLLPAAGAHLRVGGGAGSHSLVWRTSPGTGRVEVGLVMADESCAAAGGPRAGATLIYGVLPHANGAAGVQMSIGQFPCGDPPPATIPVTLRMAAFDTVYASHLEAAARSGWVAVRRAGFGLVGAVGVFAGASLLEVPLFIEPAW